MLSRFTSYELAGMLSLIIVSIVILIAAGTISYKMIIKPPAHIHSADPGHKHDTIPYHTHKIDSHTHTIE